MANTERAPQLKDAEWIVAQFSTQRNAIPLDDLSLIGISERPTGKTAILRLTSGEILCAKPGTSFAAGIVIDIADDSILLQSGNDFLSLYLTQVG